MPLVRIKITINERETRTTELPSTELAKIHFEGFKTMVSGMFQGTNMEQFVMEIQDEEGDRVLIESEEEWKGFRMHGVKNLSLRVWIVQKEYFYSFRQKPNPLVDFMNQFANMFSKFIPSSAYDDEPIPKPKKFNEATVSSPTSVPAIVATAIPQQVQIELLDEKLKSVANKPKLTGESKPLNKAKRKPPSKKVFVDGEATPTTPTASLPPALAHTVPAVKIGTFCLQLL